MNSTKIDNIIVVGASAGGMKAVSLFLASIKENLNASIFIVIHVSGNSIVNVILDHLQKYSIFPCKIPADNEIIANRTVYLAPSNNQLIVTDGVLKVQKGAFENHWRPSVDVLFRTAAAAYGSCVIGVILTGLLDDGTSGMSAIQRSGGVCMVQDPHEAEFPDMPLNVLKTIPVNYKASVNEMGYIIADLIKKRECDTSNAPPEVQKEADLTIRMSTETSNLDSLGALVPVTCPECGGSLYAVNDPLVKRYRCYTGHSFTENALMESLGKEIEESLWVAIRMMEERRNLLSNLVTEHETQAHNSITLMQKERADNLQTHIERLKKMLLEL